jgi:two-component system chemotaxis response regulator CheB
VSAAAERLVVVGASAGGVEALRDYVASLPADLDACVLVVLHLPARARSMLPAILARAGRLPVESAVDGAVLAPGVVLVAPPDHHLRVRDGRAGVDVGARENGHRPAIDVLFRSAATHRDKVLAILLSGTLDDGVQGLAVVRAAGGRTAVQDPAQALYAGMPQAALDAGVVDDVLGVAELAALTGDWVQEVSTPPRGAPMATSDDDPPDVEPDREELRPGHPSGVLSALTCPTCGGALWEDDAAGPARYTCRTGHGFGADSLLETQADALDDALWGAYRSLLEHAELNRRLARRMERTGRRLPVERYRAQAADAERRAEVLRAALLDPGHGARPA